MKFQNLNINNSFIEKVFYYDEIGSTNDEAKKAGMDEELKSALFLAEYQRAGRGRLGRTWEAPRGKDIMCSMLLRPAINPQQLAPLTLLIGQCAAEAIRGLYDLDIRIKWPNDLLWKKKKIGGILTEMVCRGNCVSHIVIGMGINCNSEEFSQELVNKALSLKSILGMEINREELLCAIVNRFEVHYKTFLVQGLTPFIEAIKSYSEILNSEVWACIGSERERVLVEDITERGALRVRTKKGALIDLECGEVTLEENY